MKVKEHIVQVKILLRGYKLYISLNIIFGVASVVLSLLFIFLSKDLVDKAVEGEVNGGLIKPALIILLVLLCQQVCNYVRGYVESLSMTKMMNALREKLFFKVMLSRWNGREKFHTGDITTRLDGDVRSVSETVCSIIPKMAITLVGFVSSFVFMMSLDARLAWVLFAIMPIAMILSKRYVFRVRKLTHSIREVDSYVQAHIQEQVQYRSLINSIGHSEGSFASLKNLSGDLFAKTMNRTNYTLFSRTVVRTGFMVGYFTAFMWGVEGLHSGAVSFGVMTAFLQLVAKVQSPIIEISSYLSTAAQTFTSVDRLNELENLEQEEQGEQKILKGDVGVKLSEVSFQYEKNKVLDGFSCDFVPNNLHLIVGQTGSGKSTMLRLMLGLLSPQSGTVELYDSETKVDCSPLTRANFVYVPQGNSLISGTIRDNILLGDPLATDEQIAEVLHTAVADFVYALPDGLDTICGERGAGLSEGEAQRIAIARGLLRKGGVLLFDEPTSALDADTENLLIERLKTYAQNRTMIMVTHREKSSQMCESVLRIKR